MNSSRPLFFVQQAKLKMQPSAVLCPQQQSIISRSPFRPQLLVRNPKLVVTRSSLRSEAIKDVDPRPEYKPGILDDFFLNTFRSKLVLEVGWDSKKSGYDGLIELAEELLKKGRTNSDTRDAAVRVLKSLFPPFLLELYKILIAPLDGGKIAAMMVARVTTFTCQWLMGPSAVNSVDLPDGTSSKSGVFVERCKYLEESKCAGICINTCKLPTQTFFKDYMGVPLLMEPNFTDYSCQFKFGVHPPLPEDDPTARQTCLEICPTAKRRQEIQKNRETQCPKA